MTKHTIILSESMSAFIDERLSEGEYATLSEYVTKLVNKEMARHDTAVRELRDLLNDAEKSGLSERSLEEILSYARSSGPKPVDTR